jgi:hypothetical protein
MRFVHIFVGNFLLIPCKTYFLVLDIEVSVVSAEKSISDQHFVPIGGRLDVKIAERVATLPYTPLHISVLIDLEFVSFDVDLQHRQPIEILYSAPKKRKHRRKRLSIESTFVVAYSSVIKLVEDHHLALRGSKCMNFQYLAGQRGLKDGLRLQPE